MNTNIILTAEEIAAAVAQHTEGDTGTLARQAIEDSFELQTDPKIFIQAIARADRWPWCRHDTQGERRYGLQYAYLLEFLICDEITRQRAAGNVEGGEL